MRKIKPSREWKIWPARYCQGGERRDMQCTTGTLRRKGDYTGQPARRRRSWIRGNLAEQIFWFLRLFFSSLSSDAQYWVCGIRRVHRNLISDDLVALHFCSLSESLSSHGLSVKLSHPVTIHSKVLLIRPEAELIILFSPLHYKAFLTFRVCCCWWWFAWFNKDHSLQLCLQNFKDKASLLFGMPW